MEPKPLEDLLNPSDEAPVAEPDNQPRDDHGRFAAKETGVEPPQEEEALPEALSEPPSDKLPPETFKGLKDEREKRQTLEKELQALRDQIASLQKPQEPQAPPPTIWEDEEGWQQHFGAQIAQQASFNATLNMSEMLNRHKHEDFDEVKTHFLAMAEQNPAIVQQALADPDPWGKAYQLGKNAKTMAELGATDVSALEAKLREKIMAEMQAQMPAARQSIPTLTTERNVGSRSGPAWAGPKSLDELLG